MSERLLIDAEWTDDCQGKKDYDGNIVSVSTRYWPQGGGFTLLAPTDKGYDWQENDRRPEVKPSAKSSILLRHRDKDYITLTEKDFEGETFEEVAAQVEAWAQEQFDAITKLLRNHFDLRR